jgi:hypothetical protein
MKYDEDVIYEAVERIEECYLEYEASYEDWLINECVDAIIYNGESLLQYTEQLFKIEDFAVYAMDNDII